MIMKSRMLIFTNNLLLQLLLHTPAVLCFISVVLQWWWVYRMRLQLRNQQRRRRRCAISFTPTGEAFTTTEVSQQGFSIWNEMLVLFVDPDFEFSLIVKIWCIQVKLSLVNQFWITPVSIGLLLGTAVQKETGHKIPSNDLQYHFSRGNVSS